jgi:hypothetical protein
MRRNRREFLKLLGLAGPALALGGAAVTGVRYRSGTRELEPALKGERLDYVVIDDEPEPRTTHMPFERTEYLSEADALRAEGKELTAAQIREAAELFERHSAEGQLGRALARQFDEQIIALFNQKPAAFWKA